MDYIHIKNLEKYNPGYTDRTLIWCKIYFAMLNSSYEFELIDDVDKWRLIALIMLELQMKKPVPYDEAWLQKKISNNKRPMSLTMQMLHNFIELVTDKNEVRHDSVTRSRVEKSRVEKNREDTLSGKPDLAFPISYLNQKAKRAFDSKNKSNLGLVKARFNEGRTLEQFKKVIDKKVAQWSVDEKMMTFIRPSTLFSRTNFENYLNEPEGKEDKYKKLFGRE